MKDLPISKLDRTSLAKLACVYSGIAWGLFWFPLRWLEAAGIEGAWVGIIFYAVQLAFVLPFVVLNPGRLRSAGPGLILTSFFAGGALALYAFAILYTEVIRAMLLYYLTPVWSTLLACWILKQPITRLRWFAIALGVCRHVGDFRCRCRRSLAAQCRRLVWFGLGNSLGDGRRPAQSGTAEAIQ